MTNAAEKITPAVIEHGQPLTPMDIVRLATERGDLAVVEKAMQLQERWEANQNRKVFDAAMASAKAEIPVIFKNKAVSFGNGKAAYRHEDMAEIARTVDPILAKHGLSYRYRTVSDKDTITVTCIVHGHGHHDENSLTAPNDTSGNKNAIQAIGSTQTYLQRYTLKAAIGLAASSDDDGRAAESGPVSEAQADELTKLVNETKTDIAKFLQWVRAESISDIPAAKFADARARLEAKKAQGAKP